MWDWLRGGHGRKLKPRSLQHVVDRLLGASPSQTGEDEPCALSEQKLKALCSATSDVLLKEPSLLEIGSGVAGAEVVVVGDLHGQFSDLQRIFERLGRPGSDKNVWVFLGDYIDRGPQGLEIVATLFALKLLHPTRIYLLRGNHECSEITVLFGFCGECQRRSTLAVWEAVMQVFDALPLAALVNDAVFLCHGGISPDLGHPRDINRIERPQDINPNGEGLLTDLLWADPSIHVNGWCRNPRGVSYIFGLDVARQWLARQGLKAIVRAHMVQAAGYEVLGDSQVITVFSAANYRNSGNTGAVLVIAPSLDFQFVTFSPVQRSLSAEAKQVAEQKAREAAAAKAAEEVAADAEACRCSLPPALAAAGPGAMPPSPFASAPPAPAVPPAAAAAAGKRAGGGECGATEAPAAVEPMSVVPPMQQDVAEEQACLQEVAQNPNLQDMVRRGSDGLQDLEQLTGGSRVPAEALARGSSADLQRRASSAGLAA